MLGLAVEPVWGDSRGGCEPWAAKVVSAQGIVEAKKVGTTVWETAVLENTFCPGDTIRIGPRSRAAVELPNETIIRLDQNSAITLSASSKSSESLLDLLQGIVYFISRVPRSLKITTPFVNAAIEGTEFLVQVDERRSLIMVFEGQVAADNSAGRLSLSGGQQAIAEAGVAPRLYLQAAPRDAVQWSLYYPPVLRLQAGDRNRSAAAEAIRRAAALFDRGDVPAALATLDGVTESDRDAIYHSYRASLLLYVGRIEEARASLQRALVQDPGAGGALALKSIIALVQNNQDEAGNLAAEALRLQPESAAPWIARSYVQQSIFDLDSALGSAQQATGLDAGNALAWARLAELQLSLGRLEPALRSARKAVELNPHLARVHWVLGFAYLQRVDIEGAVKAFEEAIRLDQGDPMSRLGLGLAYIRQGDLAQGRRQIEIATLLDPASSIIRSYLGKAYYEEKRDNLAQTEYGIAKGLAPKDPTPWFYDAILKQTANRPIEALSDLQKSIELNDNRAVYRSRLLLDQDEAARGASLARIYQDLGFDQLGLEQGYRSVNTDPGNHSAHRFLADAYSILPRHEIARVSELLQSQLLQPQSLTPVQPILSQSNITLLQGAGPARVGFLEFNPLFARNRFNLQADGVVGGNNTLGGSLIFSGIQDRFSFSLGHTHLETDGFRENNDQEYKVTDAFAQYQVSPAVSLQIGWRSRKTDRGDIALRFDPTDLRPNRRQEIDEQVARIGFLGRISPDSQLLVSLVRQDREETVSDAVSTDLPGAPVIRIDDQVAGVDDARGTTAELQYIKKGSFHNTIIGAGTVDEDADQTIEGQTTASLLNPPIELWVDPFSAVTKKKRDHTNAYIYSTLMPATNVALTLGLSYDDYDFTSTDENTGESSNISKRKYNPKIGLIWDITSATSLRLAAFRVLKRPLMGNQTIEPTQVAGFNQFFDEVNGTESKRYGLAIHQRFKEKLFGGVEFTHRDIEVPDIVSNRELSQTEKLHRAYLYWAPINRVALSTDYIYDSFSQDEEEFESPKSMKTHFLPLRVSLFSKTGVFANATATRIHQDVEYQSKEETSRFWTVDAEIGYRLPKRRGIISLGITNLFDKEFYYQDRSFQSTEGQPSPLVPERQLFARLSISF